MTVKKKMINKIESIKRRIKRSLPSLPRLVYLCRMKRIRSSETSRLKPISSNQMMTSMTSSL